MKTTKFYLLCFCMILIALEFPKQTPAATITMKDGNTLVGEIKTGTLKIESPAIGTVEMEVNLIQSFEQDTVKLKDGNVLKGKIVGGTLTVERGGQTLSVDGTMIEAFTWAGEPSVSAVSEQKTGGLYLKTVPPGADVVIDGVKQETLTPLVLRELAARSYKIEVTKDGIFHAEQTVEVKPDTFNWVTISMQKYQGQIRVTSQPPGATVFLNRQKRGETPTTLEKVEIGDYQVKIEKQNFVGAEEKVTVQPNQTSNVSVQLVEKGKLEVLSEPLEAEVSLNDEEKGKTPLIITDLDQGSYQVVLTKSGYKPYTEEVQVELRKTTSLTATLEELPKEQVVAAVPEEQVVSPVPTASPVPVELGDLFVKSDPPGAEVFIDGQKQEGITPFTLEGLTVGIHQLILQKGEEFYNEEQIEITPEQFNKYVFPLKKVKGSINVVTDPSEVTIFLDGQEVGKTPITLKDLDWREYHLKFEKSGYNPHEERVTVQPKQVTEIKVNMIIKGGIVVSSIPSEAEVFLDGQQRGKSPLTLSDIETGEHQLRLEKPGFVPHEQMVTVQTNQVIPIEVKLTKKGSLKVLSDPPEAKVWLNGEEQGETPLVIQNLDAMEYTIRLAKRRYKAYEKQVQIVPPQTERLTAVLEAFRSWTDFVTGMEFVWIEGGCFQMGSPESEKDRGSDEGPVHQVCVDGFWMGRYEVTQAQWQNVMGKNPSGFQGVENPVERVSWNDVQEFLQKLNQQVGKEMFRLPTEAEWEYACRAGTNTAYSFGNDPNKLGQYAWYDKNSDRKTHPVGQLAPNAWGLYDMHGNVWEWCQDWYASGSDRVIRSGDWSNVAKNCRSARRYHFSPDGRDNGLGFRLVRTPSLQEQPTKQPREDEQTVPSAFTPTPDTTIQLAATPTPDTTIQKEKTTVVTSTGIVETQRDPLNIRSGPAGQYDVVGKAEKGEKVVILERSGEWYKVQLQDGTVGYAAGKYIKILQ
jgi:formylglycine-generating enzyme required for sulfatase activity